MSHAVVLFRPGRHDLERKIASATPHLSNLPVLRPANPKQTLRKKYGSHTSAVKSRDDRATNQSLGKSRPRVLPQHSPARRGVVKPADLRGLPACSWAPSSASIDSTPANGRVPITVLCIVDCVVPSCGTHGRCASISSGPINSSPPRRDCPRRLSGANGEANELLGSAKQQAIGPARRPNRPVPGSPGTSPGASFALVMGDAPATEKGCSSL